MDALNLLQHPIRFMQMMQAVESALRAYPVQNALTGSIRLAAGGNVSRARAMPAAKLVQTLVAEMQVS